MDPSSLRTTVPSPEPAPTRAPDAHRLGRYELLGRLGASDVFLAVAGGPRDFRKLCVVKRLRRGVEHGGLLATRLNHPNVPQAYEVGEDAGATFLAMELLEGQSLARILHATRTSGVLPDVAFWCRIVSDALAGLHHFHELRDHDGSPLSPVHRDVRPEHVFVTYEGRVCLLDFGHARLAMGRRGVECGNVVGELGYVAPEAVTFGAIDRRADVFAMGVLLWEAITGEAMPVRGFSASEACRVRPRVSTVQRRVDPRLDAIVARALEVDPAARFPTAWSMREALERYLDASGTAPRVADIAETVTAYFHEERARMTARLGARVQGMAGARPRLALVSVLDAADVAPSGRESRASLVDAAEILEIVDAAPPVAAPPRLPPSRRPPPLPGPRMFPPAAAHDVAEARGERGSGSHVRVVPPDVLRSWSDGHGRGDGEDDGEDDEREAIRGFLPSRGRVGAWVIAPLLLGFLAFLAWLSIRG
jgi:hypothetical protein